jgi:hypothetical protein
MYVIFEGHNKWPAGKEWHQLVGSSHSIFLRSARAEAGINDDEYLHVIRKGKVDVDDLYDATTEGDKDE